MNDFIELNSYHFNKDKQYKRTSPPKLKMIDLFAGTGGFTIAFTKKNKVDVVMANDMFNKSEQIYKHNFPNHNFIAGDLNDIDNSQIPDHDILTGGYPCQPFSIAGKQLGFKDKRANVFFKIISIIKDKKPRFVVLENVKNLQSHDKGKTFTVVKNEIKKLGYYMKYDILNTCKITKIPQNRERIYMVCFRYKNDYDKFDMDFNEKTPHNIIKYLEPNVNKKFYYTSKSKIWDKLVADITENIKNNVVYQYRRYYVRENKSGVTPTLTFNMGSGGHNVPIIKDNKGIRKLTPKECFNLQGFPASYKTYINMSNSGLYSLAGNAISVPVAQKIANRIIDIYYN
jgi:DNA (cytosine-5)-methyltransferase 1